MTGMPAQQKPRLSLRDRAAQIPAKPGGRPCALGKQIPALDIDLQAEAVELILDETIIAESAVTTLAEPDVGVRATVDQVNRHRRSKCEWCKVTGMIPQL